MPRLALPILLLLLGASSAALAGAEDEYQAGLIAFAQGDLEVALVHFQTARTLAPDLLDARYQEGAVLAELGRLPAAAEAFRRVLARDPGHMQAGVDLAAVLESLGDMGELAQALTPVPAAPDGEGAGPAAPPTEPWWEAGLRFGLGYDSHILLAPEDALIELAAAGARLDLAGELQLRPLASTHHRAGVYARLRRLQFIGVEADDLNQLAVAGGGRYGLRFPLLGATLEVFLGYDAVLAFADGGRAMEELDGESGFHLQSERHDLRAGVLRLEAGRARTWAWSRSRLQNHAGDLDEYNHQTHEHCLGHVFPLAERPVDLELGVCLRWSHARSREQEVIAPRGRAGLRVAILDGLVADLALGYENEDHPRSRHGRVDDVLGAEAGLGWEFLPRWRLDLGWRHTENWSNREEFEFRRDEARLGLELQL